MKKMAVLILASLLIFTSGAAFAEKLYVGTDTAFVPFEYLEPEYKYPDNSSRRTRQHPEQ